MTKSPLLFDTEGFDADTELMVRENQATQLLVATRRLLHDQRHWVKGRLATDRLGSPVPFWRASAWCLRGALYVVAMPHGIAHGELSLLSRMLSPAFVIAERAINQAIAPDTIETWNDTRGRQHSEVLALLDGVIAERQAK